MGRHREAEGDDEDRGRKEEDDEEEEEDEDGLAIFAFLFTRGSTGEQGDGWHSYSWAMSDVHGGVENGKGEIGPSNWPVHEVPPCPHLRRINCVTSDAPSAVNLGKFAGSRLPMFRVPGSSC